MKNYLILDCYIDEPACLGVPPFISPYPRYLYGALIDAGLSDDEIEYITIDDIRLSDYKLQRDYEHVFLIGGAVVPGKYLGTRIGTLAEIVKIVKNTGTGKITVGGLINRPLKERYPDVNVVYRDIEKYAHSMVKGESLDRFRTPEETRRWSSLGAEVIKSHPWYPNVLCEIETGRGCPRLTHCSFCSEGLLKDIEFRPVEDILDEVDRLTDSGCTRFRLGRQADILQYGTTMKEFNGDFPKPSPDSVRSLFGELKKRRESGKISLLNIDNGNPGTIVSWPDEASEIFRYITDAVTEGDTLPFGIESFDENVVKLNGLKIMPEDAIEAVKILNNIGGGRRKGIPVLLPGINLIHGLKGETKNSFKTNYEYLKRIADMNLLVKRINIRKLQPYPGTEISSEVPKIGGQIQKRFEFYRDKIRSEIDTHMLRKIYPAGTVLKDIFILDCHNGYSMGKQIASYSITVKLPGEYDLKTFRDVIVTSQSERSLKGLALPLDINKAGQKHLEYIPGISRDRASDIILARPFTSIEEVEKYFENTPAELKDRLLQNIIF